MKVLVLAAGYGTRLYPLTKNTPKVLLSVKGKPVIKHIIEKLENHENITDIYVVTNNKFFPNLEKWKNNLDSKIKNTISIINDNTYSEKDKLGTVGDINYVLQRESIKASLLIILGDNFFEFKLDYFLKDSKQYDNLHPEVAVIDFSKRAESVSKYGVVKLDDNNRIIEFEEKPKYPNSTLVAAGIYFFPLNSLKLIPEYLNSGNNPDNVGYLIKWLCENYKVYAHRFDYDKWHDIGSVDTYKQLGGNDLAHR